MSKRYFITISGALMTGSEVKCVRVGQNFGECAQSKVAGLLFEGAPAPVGHYATARQLLLDCIRDDYPDAEMIEVES